MDFLNHESRKGLYQSKLPDPLLDSANKMLENIDQMEPKAEIPLIISAGTPRSGTTILSQILVYTLKSRYIDGIAARFHTNPALGISISNSIRGGVWGETLFSSDFGRSSVFDIHGYHFFWLKYLQIVRSQDLFPISQKGLEACREKLYRVKLDFGECLVIKGYYPSYDIKKFLGVFNKSGLVLTQRNPLENCLSIYDARKIINKDIREWWSMPPPNADFLYTQDEFSQITGQVYGLNNFYAAQIESLTLEEKRRVFIFDYDNFLVDPLNVVGEVRTWASNLCGVESKELELSQDILRARNLMDVYPREQAVFRHSIKNRQFVDLQRLLRE